MGKEQAPSIVKVTIFGLYNRPDFVRVHIYNYGPLRDALRVAFDRMNGSHLLDFSLSDRIYIPRFYEHVDKPRASDGSELRGKSAYKAASASDAVLLFVDPMLTKSYLAEAQEVVRAMKERMLPGVLAADESGNGSVQSLESLAVKVDELDWAAVTSFTGNTLASEAARYVVELMDEKIASMKR